MSVTGFLQWWGDELRGLLPASRRSARVAARRVVIDVQADGIGLALDDRGQMRPFTIDGHDALLSVGQLTAALVAVRGSTLASAGRLRLPVGIRVHPGDCFVHTVPLPLAAHRNFEQMLLLEMERTTPLKARDVLSAHAVLSEAPAPAAAAAAKGTAAKGMVQVRHFVVKTRRIEPLLAAIRAAGLEASFIDCWTGDGPPPPFNFAAISAASSAAGAAAKPGWPVGRRVAVLAGVLGLAAPMIVWGRHELAYAKLTAETARLQEQVRATNRSAEAQRAAGAGSETMRRLKAGRPPATVILNEVTRLLPDTAWLQEFRLDNDTVEIAGLAASASALLPVFERSPLFHETMFTGPLRLEPGEDRERFRLRTRLRPLAQGAPEVAMPLQPEPVIPLPVIPEARR